MRRERGGWEGVVSVDGRTLQKSIDFTPLLPSAGPTGGEGEAWPAPTMSLTICSLARGLRDMVGGGVCGFDLFRL